MLTSDLVLVLAVVFAPSGRRFGLFLGGSHLLLLLSSCGGSCVDEGVDVLVHVDTALAQLVQPGLSFNLKKQVGQM